MVRSHLEYCHSVWNPYKVGLISDIEKVQKRATKLVNNCKKMSYENRLKFLDLPTLKMRRLRGDMIEVFKILNGFYDSNVTPPLNRNMDSRTRGNCMKLALVRSKLDIRKYSFCPRVANAWNSLPDSVIVTPTINSFKNNLDKFWYSQEVYYNWKSELMI